MNTLELAVHVTQVLLKLPKMKLLEHMLDSTNSAATLCWNTKGSISLENVEAHLFSWKALDQCRPSIVSSGTHIPGWLNGMANDALQLTFLTIHHLLAYSGAHCPQAPSWHFAPLTSELASALTTMLPGAQCAP